jgi:MurNAc alpha-1-phosphate uridylyltransferase
MTDSLAGKMAGTNPGSLATVVLAAGEGRRLRPLTLLRPKPLCPVGNVALLDEALERVRALGAPIAVNVHYGRDQLEQHLAAQADVHVSIEADRALGTAGALGHLRGWLHGRDTVVVNADTWCEAEFLAHVEGWDHERVRLVVAGEAAFGPRAGVIASLLPWSVVRNLSAEPAHLYETTWRPAAAAGVLDVVGDESAFFDCGTPASYLDANLYAASLAGGLLAAPSAVVDGTADRCVLGDDCVVAGTARESVLWAGASVTSGETLDRAIRVSSTMTVLVR